MNGVNINTKDTVTDLNLLVVEEMCVNATGDKLRAVHFFPIRFHFLSLGTNCGEEPASPEIPPSSSLCSQHDLIKHNQTSKSHLKKDEDLCHNIVATVIYCTGAHDQFLCDCALNEAWS